MPSTPLITSIPNANNNQNNKQLHNGYSKNTINQLDNQSVKSNNSRINSQSKNETKSEINANIKLVDEVKHNNFEEDTESKLNTESNENIDAEVKDKEELVDTKDKESKQLSDPRYIFKTKLDFSHLTYNEKSAILEVMEREEQMKQFEEQRIERLKADIRELRFLRFSAISIQSADFQCARCAQDFGTFRNRGLLCPKCYQKVCSKCRVTIPKKKWLCTICFQIMDLERMAGSWFGRSMAQRYGVDDDMFDLLKKKLLEPSSQDDDKLASTVTLQLTPNPPDLISNPPMPTNIYEDDEGLIESMDLTASHRLRPSLLRNSSSDMPTNNASVDSGHYESGDDMVFSDDPAADEKRNLNQKLDYTKNGDNKIESLEVIMINSHEINDPIKSICLEYQDSEELNKSIGVTLIENDLVADLNSGEICLQKGCIQLDDVIKSSDCNVEETNNTLFNICDNMSINTDNQMNKVEEINNHRIQINNNEDNIRDKIKTTGEKVQDINQFTNENISTDDEIKHFTLSQEQVVDNFLFNKQICQIPKELEDCYKPINQETLINSFESFNTNFELEKLAVDVNYLTNDDDKSLTNKVFIDASNNFLLDNFNTEKEFPNDVNSAAIEQKTVNIEIDNINNNINKVQCQSELIDLDSSKIDDKQNDVVRSKVGALLAKYGMSPSTPTNLDYHSLTSSPYTPLAPSNKTSPNIPSLPYSSNANSNNAFPLSPNKTLMHNSAVSKNNVFNYNPMDKQNDQTLDIQTDLKIQTDSLISAKEINIIVNINDYESDLTDIDDMKEYLNCRKLSLSNDEDDTRSIDSLRTDLELLEWDTDGLSNVVNFDKNIEEPQSNDLNELRNLLTLTLNNQSAISADTSDPFDIISPDPFSNNDFSTSLGIVNMFSTFSNRTVRRSLSIISEKTEPPSDVDSDNEFDYTNSINETLVDNDIEQDIESSFNINRTLCD